MKPISFIADVHLGRLAKWLRLLGFDTAYTNNTSSNQLLQLAKKGGRILLSRNMGYSRLPDISFLHITSEDSKQQLQQVIQTFGLASKMQPFTRCLVCNGLLENVEKNKITPLLEENTNRHYHEFWRCADCNRIYWKGSHFERMTKLLNELNAE